MLNSGFHKKALDEYPKDGSSRILLLEWRESSTGEVMTLDLRKKGEIYFIVCFYLYGTKRLDMDYSDGELIENIIRNEKVAIMPQGNIGLDGCMCSILFTDGLNSAEYEWWVDPVEEWKPFGEIVEILFKYIQN